MGYGGIWPILPKSHLQKELALCGWSCLQSCAMPGEGWTCPLAGARSVTLLHRCSFSPAAYVQPGGITRVMLRCRYMCEALRFPFLYWKHSSETLICIWRGFHFPCSRKFPQVLTQLVFALPSPLFSKVRHLIYFSPLEWIFFFWIMLLLDRSFLHIYKAAEM